MAKQTAGIDSYFLRSTHLGFRAWHPSDLPLALALWGDPVVTHFITAQGFTEEDIRRRLQQEIASQEDHGIQYWPIFLLESGAHVGCCGLRPRPGYADIPELGVHIASRHWRHGYAFEATSCVIDYAFDQLAVRALFAGHNPQNAASAALLSRLGFVHTHDELYEPTGLQHPSYLLTSEGRKT
jgi:RimJ/RimL family protein N-acetyltransferase